VKFLLDQDIYALTDRFLRQLGHNVVRAAELGLSRAPDSELLSRSAQERRLLVTRDKDYGSLVFTEQLGQGVIFLRMSPATVKAVHSQLECVLRSHSEAELSGAFVVVEPGQYRFRKVK